ncbi:MAG: FeoA domain-containing protein [Gammaproteobacteria bacterium]|jgi:ferrous iron transport protein A
MSNQSIFNLSVGEFGLIEGLVPGENQYYRQRLLAEGVVPGEVLKIKRIAPFGDPIEVSLSGGNCFVIRRTEANIIKIRKVSDLEK